MISAQMSMGSKMPVDAFSPKTKARIITSTIPMPFIPDFDNPNKNTAKQMAIHCNVER